MDFYYITLKNWWNKEIIKVKTLNKQKWINSILESCVVGVLY